MIRLCTRYYSQKCKVTLRGCRVLDYTTPETHFSVNKPEFLLGARMGMRYTNADPQFDDRLELLTILRMHEITPDLRHQKRFAQFYENAVLRAQKLTKPSHSSDSPPHTNLYTEILVAPSLAQALSIAEQSDLNPALPPFVILHTLGRHATSPFDVHNALRLFEKWLPLMPAHYQPEIVVLMLRMAQRCLVDVVPGIVELFFRHAHASALSPAIANELLWQIASYGKRWSLVDTPILSRAQEIVVQRCGVDQIDRKGLSGLAYIKHFRHPETARRIVSELDPVVAGRTPLGCQHELPYAAGPLLLAILTSSSPEEALLLVDRANFHLPAAWSALALYLARSQTLNATVAQQLWENLVSRPKVRPTALLLELVLGATPDYARKKTVLAAGRLRGLRVTPALVAAMMRVATQNDLEQAKHDFAAYLTHPRVKEQVLHTESRVDPARVWETYTSMRPDSAAGPSVPSRRALQSLCRAAWDTNLKWDNLYAAQRAMREIKLHVRGAIAPADDVLRVFPTDEMLYAYVVMAGRSGYTSELLRFLPWMHAIEHQPSRRVLLALCYYSPQGPALLKMGQSVAGWPTLDEFAVYEDQLVNKVL